MAIEIKSGKPGDGMKFVGWKARRRPLLLEACIAEFGPYHCAQEWYDFCEREYRRYLAGEISGRKYVRSAR